MGLDVIAVDMDPDAVGFKEEGITKLQISTIDTPRIVEAARAYQIDGIMTLASDMPMQAVATVCEELGLIGITLKLLLMRQIRRKCVCVLKRMMFLSLSFI